MSGRKKVCAVFKPTLLEKVRRTLPVLFLISTHLKPCSLQLHELIVDKVIAETSDFHTIVFAPKSLPYKAGQYLTLVGEINGETIRRSYSLTSSPLTDQQMAIGVKRIPNGMFSRHLVDRIRAGDRLYTTGAGGFFLLPEEQNKFEHLFFLAAGSGITPILSLIKTALYQNPTWHCHLFYSSHSLDRILYKEQVEHLLQQFPGRLHLQYFVSESAYLEKARLNRDLLIGLVEQFLPALDSSMYYICGPENYMRMCTYVLRELGIAENHIRKENFAIDKKLRPKDEPPDKQMHRVTIKTDGKFFDVDVRFPETILSAAKKQGIDLPYSCETGRCGSCAALCVQGKVWLSYNEVLTDRELKKGITLTCVGHPVGGDVQLII